MFPLLMEFLQPQLRATQPNYFFPVVVLLLVAGGVAWLIASVLGFARAAAFGPSARWFTYAAVCLVIYHLHFLLFGIFAVLGISQNSVDLSMALGVGAFFNLFVVPALVIAGCATALFLVASPNVSDNSPKDQFVRQRGGRFMIGQKPFRF